MDLFYQDSQLKENSQEVDLKELNIDDLSNCTELKILDNLWKNLLVIFILSINSSDKPQILWTCRKQISFFPKAFLLKKLELHIYTSFSKLLCLQWESYISLAGLIHQTIPPAGRGRGRKETSPHPSPQILASLVWKIPHNL